MKYQLLPEQQALFNGQADANSLDILERNSITRLKQTEHKNYVLFHSSNQNHQNDRMIIFALVSKLFTSMTLSNMASWSKLKTLIYLHKDDLESCHKGVQSSQLLKHFSLKFQQILVNQEAQKNIASIINGSPFVQSVFLKTITKQLNSETLQNEELILTYSSWLQKEFNVKLTIFEQEMLQNQFQQGDNEIFLYKVNNHLMKKSYRINRLSSVSSQEKNIQTVTLGANQKPFNQYSSIHMDESNKNTPLISTKKQKTISSQRSKQKKQISSFQIYEKKNEKRTGIFSFFWCCSQ